MPMAFFLMSGARWHMVVVSMAGRHPAEALSWEMVAGCASGVAAGYFTLWSRARASGRETPRHVIATCCLAMLVYWFAGVVLYIGLRIASGPVTEGHSTFVWSNLGWILAYGTMWTIILLPLCWATRWLVRRSRGVLRPNEAWEPASAAAALAAQGQRPWSDFAH